MNGLEADAAIEEGEVDQAAPVAKVHIRGINTFNTSMVEAYARQHDSADFFNKVEWVDDASANLIYDTELAAIEALQAMTATEELGDPLSTRPAKRLEGQQDVELFVRQAVESDVKVKGASLYSRYYLDNPDEDPENRKRCFSQRGGGRNGYGNRREDSYKRPRRDIGDELYARRGSQDAPFDVDLYDDNPVAVAKVAQSAERRESMSSTGSGYHRRRVSNRDRDLFANKSDGRLRDGRSASPEREGDGRYGFSDDQPRRQTARARTPPPLPPHGRVALRKGTEGENRRAAEAKRKELFPGRKVSPSRGNGNGSTAMELFPDRRASSSSNSIDGVRDLIPAHRRSSARDIDHERNNVVDKLRKSSLTDDDYPSHTDRTGKGGDLFARIDVLNHGRLNGSDQGFSFKGAGVSDGSQGFSFKGASKAAVKVQNPLVKELFPMKSGPTKSGGDLFAGRSTGSQGRRRAEDLF